MANTLEQIQQGLINEAQSSGSGLLSLDNSIIQSDCYANVLLAANVKQIAVQVNKTNPAADIYITGTTLFVKGSATLYNGTVPDFELQLNGELEPARTCTISGTLSSLDITQLNTLGLIGTNPTLPPITFSGLTLSCLSKPADSAYATMSLTLQQSTDTWDILPDIGIDLTGVGISLVRTAANASKLGITGNFRIPDTDTGKKVNITVTIPTSTFAVPIWSIGLSAGQGETIINLGDISTLLAGTNVFSQLPPGLSGVGNFGLTALQVSFTQSGSNFSIQQIITGIGCNNWPLGPADSPIITITSAGFNISVNDPFVSASRAITTVIYGNFQLDPSDSNTNLSIQMTIPPGNADWVLSGSAQIDLSNISVFNSLPGGFNSGNINLPSEVSGASLSIDYFIISFNPSTLQLSYISFSVSLNATWWIIDNYFGIANPMLQVYIPGASLASPPPLSVYAAGQILLPDSVILDVAASYAKNGPWSFTAALSPGSQVNVIALAQQLIGSSVDPDASLGLNTLLITAFSMSIVSNPAANQTTYTLSGTTVGNWSTTFGLLPPINVEADFSITYNGKTSGSIGVTLDVFGIEFTVKYNFTTENTYTLELDWKGFSFTYDSKADVITAKGGDWTLGAILTALVNEIDPSLDFSLPDPWNLLNSISLQGLSLEINLTNKTIALKYTLSSPIELFFITITGLSISVDKSSQVNIQIDGSYLGGKPIPKWDAASQSPPAVPGSGSDLFNLKFFAIGQHVSLTGLGTVNTVQAALANYEQYLMPPNQGSTTIPVKATPANPPKGTLIFDAANSWMIAADFTVAQFYQLQFVFDDPDLYGLRIGIAAGASFFAGLDFEIMYKKVSDTIGMYQLNLQLPDEFRHLEFGEVSITLPNVMVQVYTNGNFYIDFGFPASITDFSRSFSVQVFPFVGYGGFYFGMLSGATSTSVPTTTYGQFNPVIVAGLGLSLGVGKTIDEGILSAGLSLTVVGIFEGVLGFYTCYADSSKTATYYRFSATVGIIGHIYGQVNFAIISAQFDVLAYIYATLVIESYRAIPINFQAGVSVKLTVKINLGLFKISISLSFSATIKASFTIGTDTWSLAPWNNPCVGGTAAKAALAGIAAQQYKLVWQPLKYDSGLPAAPAVTLYFIPHLTLGEGTGNATAAQYVAMLYIDAPAPTDVTDNSSLGSMARGVLAWAINAIVNSGTTGTTYSQLIAQNVTADQLTALMCVFNQQQDNQSPFNYINPSTAGNDVRGFLQAYFNNGTQTTINIVPAAPETDTTMHAAVFPPMPDLQLNAVHNGTTIAEADFATVNMTGTQNYIGDITSLLQLLNANFMGNTASTNDADPICSAVDNSGTAVQTNLSLPTFFFTDFISLIAKQMIQNAVDYIQGKSLSTINIGELFTNVCTPGNTISLSGMASRFLLHGLRLPTPPVAKTGIIEPLYVLTGQQFTIPALNPANDTFSVSMLKAAATNWISFNGNPAATAVSVDVSSTEMTRITQTASVTMTPVIETGYPASAPVYSDGQQAFTLGSPALWQYPGDYFPGVSNEPYVLKLPSNLQNELAAYTGSTPAFTVQYLDTTSDNPQPADVTNYMWATSVNVSIQRISLDDAVRSPLAGNMYNLIGTDDTGVFFLENLVSYLNSTEGKNFSGQIQLLYQPDPANNSNGGYISAPNNTTTPPDKIAIAIIQANLSTETNPEQGFMFAAAPEDDTTAPNMLNSFQNFITLLWECSIVRSGGFYLYYNDIANGNAGLPDALFNGSSMASLELLITYNDFTPQPFLNSMVIGDNINYSNASVYAQSPSFMMRTALMLQGNVGYVLQRADPGQYNPPQDPNTPPSLQEDEIYLENQFNLLGVTLPAFPLYQNLLPSGPVDGDNTGADVKTSDDGTWNYSGTIPYNNFAAGIQNSWNITDPYAGIGTTASLLLNWQDMFGNTLPLSASLSKLDIPVLYTDNIVAVSQWSSASVHYEFTGDGTASPVFKLTFTFNTSRYSTGDQSAQNNAAVDLVTWARLWFQLSHTADMQLSYTVSINATAAVPNGSVQQIDITNLLSQFVTPVVNYLYAIAQGKTPPPAPADYVLSQTIDPATVTSYQYIFALATVITMQRTANIDPAFKDVPGVASSVTVIQPYMQQTGSGGSSLLYFAQTFETAFNSASSTVVYKVSTATNLTEESSDPVEAPPVWIIRFDTSGKQGISVTYDKDTSYFTAPIPMATSLQSFSGPVIAYTTGQPFDPAAKGTTTNFSSVDLDTWGLQLLEAVDKFLSPTYAVPAFLLDNGTSLQGVLDAKQLIAEAVAGMVDYIIQPTDTPDADSFNNAQQKWYQQLLIELAAAYEYTAAVQRPVTIQSCWTGPNTDPPFQGASPRLYGKVSGIFEPGEQSDTEQNAIFSASKLPVASGDSWMTFMFQIDNSQSQSADFAAVEFAVSHIEWQYEQVEGIDGYLASSWLLLLIPQSLPAVYTDFGAINIPVPLKSYPASPSVTGQSSNYPSENPPKSNDPVTLARSWDYTYTYQAPSAAQDTTVMQVQLNVTPPQSLLTADADTDSLTLEQALAQFTSMYPQLSNDFDNYLVNVKSSDDSNAPDASNAVNAFTSILNIVGNAWKKSTNQVHPFNPSSSEDPAYNLTAPTPASVTLLYTVEETENVEVSQPPLIINVTPDPQNTSATIPLIDIAGYTRHETSAGQTTSYTYTNTDSGDPLLYADRNKIPGRTATIPTLDVFETQNAGAGLQLQRNLDLLLQPGSLTEWQTTNPLFVYQTPMVMFYTIYQPLFSLNDGINIATIPSPDGAIPQTRSLSDQMTALTNALTTNIADLTSLTVKLECSYQYEVGNTQLPIEIPVMLVPPYQLTIADQGAAFAAMLAGNISLWFGQHNPGTDNASWSFSLQVYSSFGNNLPILSRTFYLPLTAISS